MYKCPVYPGRFEKTYMTGNFVSKTSIRFR
jgi:hypothetical protein